MTDPTPPSESTSTTDRTGPLCDRTVVAMLTPSGRGAVATVVVDGPRATDCVAAYYRPHGGGALAIDRISVGQFDPSPSKGSPGKGPPDAALPGEEIVACQRSERRIELHCHGGEVAARVLLTQMVDAGCEACDWQTWVDHSATSPIAAEALTALAAANTTRTAGVLLAQYHGALEQAVRDLIDRLVAAGTAPTETSVEEVAERLDELIGRYRWGQHLTVPLRVVIAGRPNVGKSSLINHIVGYERALVFDQPGTTRDVVWVATAIDGWPVELADTAGLRSGAGAIESLGIERARAQLAAADLIMLVHDAGEPHTAADLALRQEWPDALLVANKVDLVAQPSQLVGIATSALTGEGVERLLADIALRLLPDAGELGRAEGAIGVPFTPRQQRCLQAAADALGEQLCDEAIIHLQQLIGGDDDNVEF